VEDSDEAYVGLDVAMKETAICIVDDGRRIVREGRERARSHCRVPERDRTGFRAGRHRGGAVGALVVRRPGRRWSAGDLHRCPAHESSRARHADGFSTGPNGLDQSVANGEIDRENFVCWDLTHPDAFKDTGQFSILDENGNALITKADIALTKDAISAAGDSKGLHYNIFCGGNVALADGRWLS
jgi:hypothetical protein